MNVLTMQDVRKSFGSLEVLKGISLTVGEGEAVSVIGPSGSGKSTLLRCATLLETMDGGSLAYGNDFAATMDAEGKSVYADKAALRRIKSRFGLVFQQFNLFPHYTVLKNVTDAPLTVQRRERGEVRELALSLLEKMGLADKADAYPCQLSGGQQQRVAIARALATDPKVLLCDEATSALDPNTTHQILELIKDINKKLGITVVVITHQMSVVKEICSHVAILDNGVVEEGVSVTPRSVTAAQAVNMTNYCTGMSAMAHHFGDEIQVVDVGIADEYDCPAILNRKILPGTRNLAREPAMTRQEAARSVWTGMELARQAKDEGVAILGAGEMGIGNTTTSAAVLAALTGLPVEAVTGRGGGMTDAGFLRKKQVITDALALHRPDKNDVLDVLSKVGGLDIAAMCGVFLGAARQRLPVVIDGFISVVAALCAGRLCPAAEDYFFASHASHEVGYAAAVKELGLEPWLHLGMRLGEGSGCPIALRGMEAACAAAEGMATFAGAAIDDSYLDDIRGKDCF